MNKDFVVFAGVNGAGKTSIYNQILKEHFPELGRRINSDELLQDVQGDWKNLKDQVQSGKRCLQMQKEFFEQNISFHRETTFSSREILKTMEKAIKLDYCVTIYFVHLERVDIALKRVQKRVSEGGHGISDTDVIRRYTRAVENLKYTLKNLPVNVYFYDNSHAFPEIVGECIKGRWCLYADIPWLNEIYQKDLS